MRILFVSGLPGDDRLGATRPPIELGHALQNLGHAVDFLWGDEVSSGPRTSVGRRLAPPSVRLPRGVIAARAAGFDVIDAQEGHVPFTKSAMGYRGLLVARSTGLTMLYEDFTRNQHRRWPDYPGSRLLVRPLRRAIRLRALRDARRSLQAADVINVPNADEALLLRSLGLNDRVLMLPLGLLPERAGEFRAAAQSAAERRQACTIAFIGMWMLRKGAYEWGDIVRRVRAIIPRARFLFLGTSRPDEIVWRDLCLPPCEWIQIVRSYAPGELPHLLSRATVGAFPSYLEAFGLAVLEKLAAGLPTVAYDAPGAREMLASAMPEMLVPAGDARAFADKLVDVMQASEARYHRLAETAVETAQRFSWSTIAERTADAYGQRLAELN